MERRAWAPNTVEVESRMGTNTVEMGSNWCPKGAMGAIKLGQRHQREGFPQKWIPFWGPKSMENDMRRSNGPNSEANEVPRGVPGRHPKQGLMSGLFWGPPPNRKSVLSSRQEHSFRGRPQVLFGTLFGTRWPYSSNFVNAFGLFRPYLVYFFVIC